MPSRRYTEQQFRDGVADPEVRTMADLCRAVGIVPRGANYESLRAFADAHGIDVERILALRMHLPARSGRTALELPVPTPNLALHVGGRSRWCGSASPG